MALTSLPKLASETGSSYSLDKQSFGGNPPPLKAFDFDKPIAIGLSRPVSGLREQSTDDKFGLTQEWDGISTGASWDVKGEDLEMIPWEFPLEKTNREIKEDACVIANRISKVLRLMSVEAEYCSKKAKAKCKTTDYVSFRIRLFAGGENGQPVVVELQRRNGSASSFMRTCRAVLDAAEGKVAKEAPSSSTRSLPPSLKVPVSSMSCLSQVATANTDFEAEAKEALQGAIGLFRSNLRDTSLLGLENLCYITDPVKTTIMIAACVSKSLLTAEDVREELRILIERDVFSVEDNDQEGPVKFRDHQRYLCLHIFANAVSMCSKEGSLKYLVSDEWFAECFLPLLIDELNRVETGLHNAFQATVCLHGLLSCSPAMCQAILDNGAKKALEKAFNIGQSRHELLACQSRNCLDVLSSVR